MSSAGAGGLSAPPDSFSACYVVPHKLTQCLSQLLASAPWWSTACIILFCKFTSIFFEIFSGIYLETFLSYYFVNNFFLRIKPGHVGVGCQLCLVRTWV